MKLLYADASPETSNLVRTLVFGLWAIKLAFDPLHQLSELPVSIFNPPSPLTWLPSGSYPVLLHPLVLWGLRISCVATALFVVFGRRILFFAPLFCALITVHQSIIRGYAAVNHSEIALILSAYAFALFAWADWLETRKNRGETGLSINTISSPLVATVVVLLLAYTCTGVFRLAHGGLEIFTGNSMVYFAYSRAFLSTTFPFGFGQYVADYPAFASMLRLGFPVVTIIEATALFGLVSRSYRFVFLMVIVPFHIMTLLVMNIWFWENLSLLVLLLDLDRFASPQKTSNVPPVLFFDGVCGLCNRFVDWILRRDRLAIFRFSPLQGDAAKSHSLEQPEDPMEWTMVLVDEAGTFRRSEAVIRAVERLGGIHRLIVVPLRWIPRALRDGIYDWGARSRYRLFGKRPACRIPSPKEQERFLD